MLFKRRTPPGWWETVRVALWPRRSWLRSGQYVTKRVLRITASPHAVAAGVAVGALTSFTPFLGLHFLIAALGAWLLRGNVIASALGTFVGNPITFPLIWTTTYKTGHAVLGSAVSHGEAPPIGSAMGDLLSAIFTADWTAAGEGLAAIWAPILWPMTVGGLLLGPLVAVPLYFLTRRATILFRENRRNRLLAKATALRDRARAVADAKRGAGAGAAGAATGTGSPA